MPNIIYFLILLWLLLLTIFNIIFTFFVRLLHFYFLNQPDFLFIDALLITTTTILSLCYAFYNLPSRTSIYFWSTIISICVFITFTYISATFPLIKKDLNKYCAHENDTFPEQIKLFSDEPINDEMDDLIGRRNFASTLKEHIYDLSIEESFVMALYGRWGEGKTSILNLLKKEMEKSHIC